MSQACAEWRGDLGAYVIGALDREERAAMRRHLAACPACRADYADLLPVRDWLARTKRHLAACRACRTDYEDLLRLRLAQRPCTEF
jgi:predicted anti-sigma-YlaC factor YlaD